MRSEHDLRLLGAACCGWGVLAVLLALRASATEVVVVALAAAALGGALFLSRVRRALVVGVAFCAVVTALIATAAGGQLAHQRQGPLAELAAERASGTFEAVVTGQPRALEPKGPGAAETRYLVPLTAHRVQARGTRVDVATPVVLIGDGRWRTVPWRARLDVKGRLAPSERLGSAQALLVARGGPRVLDGSPPVIAQLEVLRRGLSHAARNLPDDPRGLVPALVVGDVAAIPAELNDDMSVTGMSHLNAVSGSNVTIVLVAASWCLSWCGLRRRARTVVALLVVLLYVLVCHPDPSVVRAGAMGIVGLLGTSWGRPKAACPALGAAITLLLMWDPWLAVSAGFALSALATLGLVLFAKRWANALTERLPQTPSSKLTHAIELCLIPVAAQALCLPILVALSGAVSLVSLPANVLAEPFVAPATLAGMVVLLVAPLVPALADLLVWAAGLPAWVISTIAHVAASVPGGSLPWPSGAPGIVLAVVLLAALLFGWRIVPWLGLRGWAFVTLVALVPAALWLPIPGEGRADPGWLYAQCDVGQGDAALVRTGEQAAILVDTGPEEGDVTGCLDRHGVTRVDAVVLTHLHADHVDGLGAVLERQPSVEVFVTWLTSHSSSPRGGRGERDADAQTRQVLRRYGKVAQRLAPGQQVRVGDAVLDVLWPRRALAAGSPVNNASLVLDVATPSVHALMLGDVEREAQAACIGEVTRRAASRPYDLVKVAHHGSANQSAGLYRAASARVGLIGVGGGNDYGHPKESLLSLLAQSGTAVYRTDLSGDLDVVPVGRSLTVEPQR